MPAVVVVGAQWGDEGKGKVVDLYSRFADLAVRYGGGANAGHTLVVGGEKLVLHIMPSGALHEGVGLVVGQGVVVDAEVLVREVEWLGARKLLTPGRLTVSDRAHVVLPYHKVIDGLREARSGDAIGTTKRGIGPCYEDKAARRGVRVVDLCDPVRLRARVGEALEAWRPVAAALGGELPGEDEVVRAMAPLGEKIAPHVGDAARRVEDALAGDGRVLAEGAQGTMLDLDHGTYPFVTSSSATAGGACTGAGIPPTAVRRVIGIGKAYTTRVGGGPFPTELLDDVGERLRKAGAEFGATTGRPRRCGWLDAVVLRHAVRVNGLSEIVLTKLDVLAGIDPLQVCVAYDLDGRRIDAPPPDGIERVAPVYEQLPGFPDDVARATDRDQLPANARRYIERCEQLAGCTIRVVSVGPGREQTLNLADPFA